MMAKANMQKQTCKNAKALGLLAQCRQHGSPLSTDNSDLLNRLTDKEVVLEVQYLKATIAKDLKLKKRVTESATKESATNT